MRRLTYKWKGVQSWSPTCQVFLHEDPQPDSHPFNCCEFSPQHTHSAHPCWQRMSSSQWLRCEVLTQKLFVRFTCFLWWSMFLLYLCHNTSRMTCMCFTCWDSAVDSGTVLAQRSPVAMHSGMWTYWSWWTLYLHKNEGLSDTFSGHVVLKW